MIFVRRFWFLVFFILIVVGCRSEKCAHNVSDVSIRVDGNSMLPALTGGTCYETCEVCGFHGPRNDSGAAVCPNCGWIVPQKLRKCADMEIRTDIITKIIDKKPKIGDIVLALPNSEIGTVVKRVVACPGDTLEFRNGKHYVNGHRVVRSLNQIRETAILVHHDAYRPRGKSRWRSNTEQISDLNFKGVWKYDSTRDLTYSEENPTLTYYHEEGRLSSDMQGNTKCVFYSSPITNRRAENGTQMRADQIVAVDELLCAFDFQFESGTGFVAVHLPKLSGNHIFVVIVGEISDYSEKLVREKLANDDFLTCSVYFWKSAESEKTEKSRLIFSTLDGVPRFWRDGCPQKSAWEFVRDVPISSDIPSFPKIRFCGKFCAEFSDISLYREEFFGNILTNFNYFPQFDKKVLAISCDSGYYLLGDNFGSSNDSRHWGLVSPEKILGVVRDTATYINEQKTNDMVRLRKL